MKKHLNWPVAFLLVALVGTSIWGIVGQVNRARYRVRLKTMYERSYYSFVTAMDDLEVNLSKLMVSDAPEQDVLLLSRVTKLAGDTGRELSALTVDGNATAEVMNFVAKLEDYCQVLAQQTAEGRPISAVDRENLGSMLERQLELNNMVRGMNVDALSNVDAGHVEPNTEENPFYASIEPETQVPALIYDGPFSDAAVGKPKALDGEWIDEVVAQSVALGFVGEERVTAIQSSHGMEGDMETYGLTLDTRDAGRIYMQITKKGGHVLMMMPETSPKESNYSVEQCRQSAEGFLYAHGYGLMEANYWQMYSGIVVFNFCPVVDGIRLYPDLVKVQISMETGQVIGFEAGNYLRNHVQRSLPEPVLSQSEALAKTQAIEIGAVRLCVIPTAGEEKFCYEISGKRGDDRYLIYVNAQTGRVENILKLLLEDDKEMVI